MALFGVYNQIIFATSPKSSSLLPSLSRGDLPLFLEAVLRHGHSLENIVSIVKPNSEALDFEYT